MRSKVVHVYFFVREAPCTLKLPSLCMKCAHCIYAIFHRDALFYFMNSIAQFFLIESSKCNFCKHKSHSKTHILCLLSKLNYRLKVIVKVHIELSLKDTQACDKHTIDLPGEKLRAFPRQALARTAASLEAQWSQGETLIVLFRQFPSPSSLIVVFRCLSLEIGEYLKNIWSGC